MSENLPIADRLKEERARLRMNQTDFAKYGGASRKTQYSYESGESLPDAGYLSEIAKLGVDVGYILTGQRSALQRVHEEPPPYGEADPRRTAIIHMLYELDGDGLDHVQDAAEMAKQVLELKTEVNLLKKRKAG